MEKRGERVDSGRPDFVLGCTGAHGSCAWKPDRFVDVVRADAEIPGAEQLQHGDEGVVIGPEEGVRHVRFFEAQTDESRREVASGVAAKDGDGGGG